MAEGEVSLDRRLGAFENSPSSSEESLSASKETRVRKRHRQGRFASLPLSSFRMLLVRRLSLTTIVLQDGWCLSSEIEHHRENRERLTLKV